MSEHFALSDYSYALPQEQIAQTPSAARDLSRLFVLDRKSGSFHHRRFCDVTDYLQKGDAIVINNSKVIPARLRGRRETEPRRSAYSGGDTLCSGGGSAYSGGECEVLLLERKSDDVWEALVRPGKRLRPGARISFGEKLRGEVLSICDGGNRLIRFEYRGEFFPLLDEIGEMPIPPYIRSGENARERYQTVYAEHEGSSAAPTAGLHFTKELLEKISRGGIEIIPITLHVGLGTFRPVKAGDIREHKMHSEYYTISRDSADRYNRVKRSGGRIIAVGTTSCRTLESAADENGLLQAGSNYTKLFIYPGYSFRAADGLITNFHLPESTLLMLVCAFAGREKTLEAYACAVKQMYRFFSYGDAMLIV